MKKGWFFALLLCLLSVMAPPSWGAEKEYVIGKGDVLSIRVWGEDSLSSEAVVRPDGRISLLGVGILPAAGLTTSQLQHSIAARLRNLVHEPIVSIAVHSFPNNSVVVHGPGIKPAVVPMQGKSTVLHILSQVSPDSSADLQNAYVERAGQRVASDFSALFLKGENVDHLSNIEVKAGDRIYIPLRQDRLIFVEGAVTRPTSLSYYEGMTVLEAIHLAGGFTKFADRNSTAIMRKKPGGQEKIRVKLHDLTERGDFSQNVLLQGGDIIVVKKSWF